MERKGFFSLYDKAAFWTATLGVFAVYFYTLGPSVGLEDSGELATAAAHLGVPHPPGYPFWTFCSWMFCKVFGFVSYMGHPTPAWAVSLCSAVFGAFASGCTAMLICRSAMDMLSDVAAAPAAGDGAGRPRSTGMLCFAGGVGGALAFALSPVEWSQSTIVEIYSLNALFLMWVFLLSYRWMRRPSEKTLWLVAFVFGLGLTNYQVLLFAIVPLAIIIAMKNFSMFVDFALYLAPAALVYQILLVGEMPRATSGMDEGVIAKHAGVVAASCPSTGVLVAAFAFVIAGVAAAAWLKKRDPFPRSKFLPAGLVLAGIAIAGGALLFPSQFSWAAALPDCVWTADAFQVSRPDIASTTAPLVDPKIYVYVALLTAGSIAASVTAYLKGCSAEDGGRGVWKYSLLAVSGFLALMAVAVVDSQVPQAGWAGYEGVKYDWAASSFTCHALIAFILVASLFTKCGLAYSIPVCGFHLAAFHLLQRGAMNGLVHPSSWWFWWPVVWNFIVLALAWLVLKHGRAVALSAFFTQLGVSFYAYMPFVSDLRNPPMNWAYPRTWEGFKHAITRGQYEAISLPAFKDSAAVWEYVKGQMAHYFTEVKMQFSDFIVFFALVPFAAWKATFPGRGGRTEVRCVWLAMLALAVLFLRYLMSLAGVGEGGAWLVFDRTLLTAMSLVGLVGISIIFFRQIVFRSAIALRRFVAGLFARRDWIAIAALAALVIESIVIVARFASAQGNMPRWVWAAIAALAVAYALVALFASRIVLFFGRLSSSGWSIGFEPKSVSQQWLFASGVCFLVMTVPLIALAQVKGDLQDGFIQKVKFISSHAMIALWIGYGLAFAGVTLTRFASSFERLKKHSFGCAAAVSAAVILCSGIAPVVQNYTDDELVRKFGGSEQNGHTFGWQFGAYQLDGAKAIRSQLAADEEPLPDPAYPPAMDPYAIFFGGTDPGRFVPTYMIYSANFRPDVYLITQNALADDTYMAVERDLYGDEIWIPSKEDSATAFSIYRDEVARGVRQPNGELKEVNGRIQVTGALGVMELNAILSEMMFVHDRDRRSFYVEESYAIDWMYPYLSPHGLIMKINKDKAGYDPETAARDRDFWDWYSKRLMDDPMYRRDFAAQKSFSKLRAAIAGLYRMQGRPREASSAYREAHLLYPASPEATFRYASEILLPSGRIGAVLELMDYTDSIDPNNKRTERLRRYADMTAEAARLEGKRRTGAALSKDEWMLLSDAYIVLGRIRDSGAAIREIAPSLSERGDIETAIDRLLASGFNEDAANLLKGYLSRFRDPRAKYIVQMAALQYLGARTGYAYSLIDLAASKNAAETARELAKTVEAVPGANKDATLLLKLSKIEARSGLKDRAIEHFAAAWEVSPAACQSEIHRDRELKRLIEPLIMRNTRR